MSKITCKCGALLVDSTDFLSFKGHLIPDQDIEDLNDDVENNKSNVFASIHRFSKQFYQCHQCQRLIIELDNDYLFFSADDPATSHDALRSVQGENWKRHLRAHWVNNKGSMWWGFGVEDEGYECEVGDWDDLHAQYFQIFERLLGKGVLRDSFLQKDGETIHEWPAK